MQETENPNGSTQRGRSEIEGDKRFGINESQLSEIPSLDLVKPDQLGGRGEEEGTSGIFL